MALLPQDPAVQKKLAIALAPLLLAGAYYYFVHGSSMEAVQRQESRLQQLEQRNRGAQELAARSGPELENRLAIYEQHMLRLEQLIPQEEEVPLLLSTIAQRAQDAGIEIDAFAPGRSEPGEHYNRQSFEIRVIGRYHDVGQFLSSVGSLSRIITSTNLQLGPHATRTAPDGTPFLLAAFRMQTYVLPTDTTMAPLGET